MKKKSIKVAKRLINFIMTILLTLSICALALSIYNSASYNVEVSKYIYLFLGVFLIPIEYILKGTVSMFQEPSGVVVSLIVSLALAVLSIVVMSCSSKMFNGKYSAIKRTIAGTITNFLLAVFLAFFAFGAVVLTVNSGPITNLINSSGPEFIKLITINYGFNLILIKELVVGYLGTIVCVLGIVMFIVGMSHKSSKVKIISSIYFYSDEYEDRTSQAKQAQVNNEETIEEAVHTESPQAKELINKIMQLEELKKSGKLTDVQYTHLRQKAIRRYKD